MIVFGLHTGLRPQELRELTRSQLHDDGNGNYAVFIQHHKTAKSAHEPIRSRLKKLGLIESSNAVPPADPA